MMGMLFNYLFLINNELIDLKLRFVSLEINYIIAQCITIPLPVISIMEEPWPTVYLVLIFIIALMVTLTMSFKKDNRKQIHSHSGTNHDISEAIITSLHDSNMIMVQIENDNLANKWHT
jgi:hypothetical protein